MTTSTTNEQEENKKLRELLWIRHGCSFASLYGDDGEMQCNACLIDFKRATAAEIEQMFRKPKFEPNKPEKYKLSDFRPPIITPPED